MLETVIVKSIHTIKSYYITIKKQNISKEEKYFEIIFDVILTLKNSMQLQSLVWETKIYLYT